MPKQQTLGFYTKGHGRSRKVIPLRAGYSRTVRPQSRMSVASVVNQPQRTPLRGTLTPYTEASKTKELTQVSAPKQEQGYQVGQWVTYDNHPYKVYKDDDGMVTLQYFASNFGRWNSVKVRRDQIQGLTEMPPPKAVGSVATYNKATGWLSWTSPGKPEDDVRFGLKTQGFRYEPYSKRWRASYTPSREDHLKQLSGDVETVDIPVNYEAKAANAFHSAAQHEAKANEASERAHKIADAIPFGQPILVGHHSEAHHRADINRIDNLHNKSVEESEIAGNQFERAQRYSRLAKGENPSTIQNRIKKLEADKRKMQRELQGDIVEVDGKFYRRKNSQPSPKRKEEINKWIAFYDTKLEVDRAKYKASGGIATDKMTLAKGDRVKTKHGLGTVGSVSDKTLRVLLDPMDNGSPRWIYANAKGESLLSKSDILGKVGT